MTSSLTLPRLLVVDDIPDNIKILLGMLEDDYELSFATSGRQALNLLETKPKPDLILLDAMMPEMDGYAVCTAIRKNSVLHDIPIIFVTARNDAESESEALRAGAVDFIAKPVNKTVLRTRIQLHLQMKQRTAQLERSLEELREMHRRLQVLSTAVEQNPISMMIAGPDATIEYVNPCFTRETGYSAAEVIGQTPQLLDSELTCRETITEIKAHLRQGLPWSGELILRRRSGEPYWSEVHIAPVCDAEGRTVHYIGAQIDVTERKRANERLAYLAHHDVLTHLPNRSLFFEHLAQGLTLAKRYRTRLALMFIDLDRFKPINDVHGHEIGDRVLQEAAQRMTDCVRKSDVIGRIGGDEFVVFLPEVSEGDSAVRIAEKIRWALSKPFIIDGQSLVLSASIGVALYPEHGSTPTELVRNADAAMYRAKQKGRNNVQLFGPE